MVSQMAARTLGSSSIFEARDQRREDRSDVGRRRPTAAPLLVQPCAAWPIALAASARTSGSAKSSAGMMSGMSAGRSRRPSARTARMRRLRIAAAHRRCGASARSRARRRAPIFGLENREPRRRHDRARLRARSRRRGEHAEDTEAAEHTETRSAASCSCWSVTSAALRALSAQVPRRRRVLEHLLREIRGYEIVTSVISPAASLHRLEPRHDEPGVRRQIQSLSTRATTSSRSVGSKWTP